MPDLRGGQQISWVNWCWSGMYLPSHELDRSITQLCPVNLLGSNDWVQQGLDRSDAGLADHLAQSEAHSGAYQTPCQCRWRLLRIPAPPQVLWRVCFPSNLAIRHRSPIFTISTLGRTIGPFRLWLCQAHVQTLIPNIDGPEYEVVRSHALELTCTHAYPRKLP
jgi:hypothetical protein